MNKNTLKAPVNNSDIISEFDELVRSFNGSSAQTDMLLDLGAQLEDIGYDSYGGLTKAIDNLTQGFNAAYQAGGMNNLLDSLKEKGIIVNPARLPIIPPGEGEIKTGSGNGVTIRKEDRLEWVIDALLRDDITTDQFFIEPGLPIPGAFRKEPYFLINLPGFGEEGRQIGVCNLYGAVTFVSDHIYAPEFYAQYSIEEVKALPGFDSFKLNDREKWRNQLIDFVRKGLEPKDIQTPDIQKASQKLRSNRLHLTPGMVFEKMLEEAMPDREGSFPSSDSKEDIIGWKDWNWGALNQHVNNNLPYKGIASLRDAQICEQAKIWLEQHSDHPRDEVPPLATPLPDYPHVTFGVIDDALQNMRNKRKVSLWRVLVSGDDPVIMGEYLEAADMTSSMIFKKMLEKAMPDREGSFPSSDSKEDVIGWKEWNWEAIRSHAKNKLSYSGIASLRDAQICKQVKIWLDQRPDHPRDEVPPLEAPLPDYPHVTFGVIDDALQNMKGSGKTSLWRVLSTEGIVQSIEPYTANIPACKL